MTVRVTSKLEDRGPTQTCVQPHGRALLTDVIIAHRYSEVDTRLLGAAKVTALFRHSCSEHQNRVRATESKRIREHCSNG